MSRNTYTIKKEPIISIAPPSLRFVFEEDNEKPDLEKEEEPSRDLGLIDPAIIRYVDRMISSHDFVIFGSNDKACKSLLQFVKEMTSDAEEFIVYKNIEP